MKFLQISAIMMLFLVSVFSVSCNQDAHSHTFSTEWSSDEECHWHDATCGHNSKSEKAEHEWDDGFVIKVPTHTKDGTMEYTCLVCGRTKDETIPASIYAHTWNSGVVTKESTHTTDGVVMYTCIECLQTITEAIPALVDAHTFSDEWSCDSVYHWHVATCGHDVVSDKAEHVYNDEGKCESCSYEDLSFYDITSDGVLTVNPDWIWRELPHKITIPEKVDGIIARAIGDYAFSGRTEITSVVIPDSVTSIGKGAFRNCNNLTSITLPFIGNGEEFTHFGYIFGADSCYDNWFPSALKEVVITAATSIDDYAFYNCRSVSSITISDSATIIGKNAFDGCTGLTSITIGDSVTSIGDAAFRNCINLNSITIGKSVSTIGQHAFYQCTSLTNVYVSDLSTWCKIIFPDDFDSNPMNFAKNLYIGGQLLSGSIELSSDITEIKDRVFYNCKHITRIVIPDSVTSIGKGAFLACTGLTSISFAGTKTQWGAVTRGSNWNEKVPASVVQCSDGDVPI